MRSIALARGADEAQVNHADLLGCDLMIVVAPQLEVKKRAQWFDDIVARRGGVA
jgi:hypothetical protein